MDKRYFYVADKREVEIWLNPFAKFVSPGRGRHIVHVGAKLAASTRLSIDPGVPNSSLVVRGEVGKLTEICGYSDVSATRSCFFDEYGAELILTDDVIVKFAKSFGHESRERLCRELGCDVVGQDNDIHVLRVQSPVDEDPLHLANMLAGHPAIEFAEPDFIQGIIGADVAVMPVDPRFGKQWYMNNTETEGADIGALSAWALTEGSPDIRVAIVDDGVDIGHPDLKDNIAPGFDFDNMRVDPTPDGNNAHGTACAGLVAASRNGIGIVGMAPDCKIVPIRSRINRRSQWAKIFEFAGLRCDVLCCAWLTPPSTLITQALSLAVENGRGGKGIPCFGAAGNHGAEPIAYPASLDNVIAVGASTRQDTRAGYSAFGEGLDFLVPSSGLGKMIETTDLRGNAGKDTREGASGDYRDSDDLGGGFGRTSAATAVAAGVAALMLSENPNLTATEVRQILQRTARKIEAGVANYDPEGRSRTHGFGVIHAGEALKEVRRIKNG